MDREKVQLWAIFGLIGAVCALSSGLIVLSCRLPAPGEMARTEEVMALIRKQDATILELRHIIAMQREDPKAFPRLKEQFEEIDQYESGTSDSGSDMRGFRRGARWGAGWSQQHADPSADRHAE